VSTTLQRPPDDEATNALHGGLALSTDAQPLTLGSLPVGARLILRCRKDWRVAAVALVAPDSITLTVASPSGHTYRLRRPPDSPLSLDGAIPILGEGQWRFGLARYDVRW